MEGTARLDSGLDLAVLLAGYADPPVCSIWPTKPDTRSSCSTFVESTVMQYPILVTDLRWWAKESTWRDT